MPITSGCELDYPPYCIVTADGKADGFAVELLRAALKAMGREVTFKTGPWPEIRQDLADGRIQVLPLVGRTPEREAMYDFTFPYLTMHGAIVVRADSKDIHEPADLRGKRVAVLRGDNAEEYLNRADLGAVVVPRLSFETALQELSAGQHDAVVVQKLVAYQIMARAGLKNLITVGQPLQDFTQSFCFAVRKGDTRLLATLNEGLSLVLANGTFRTLHAKWFSHLEALGRKRTELLVRGDLDFPPYEFLDKNGTPTGFNVDLTRAIARHAGLSVDVRLGPWSSIREGLAAGRVDIVQGMFYSVDREQSVSFSAPHSVVQYAFVVRQGSPELTELKDLAGKSVLVMKGDIMEDLAVKEGYGARLVAVSSQEEALRLLAEGKHDAALVAKVPALYWIRLHDWKILRVSPKAVLAPEYCFAVPHGENDVLAALNEGLAAVKESGEFRKIQAKWLSPYEASGPDVRKWMRIAALILTPLLALILALLLWSQSLKRQVAKQTQALVADIAARERTAEELRQSEAKLRILFDTMVEGLALNEIVYDDRGEMIDYRILEVNRAFYTVADYTSDQVIGALATKLYGMSTEQIQAFWRSHRNRTESVQSEMASPLSPRTFLISASPFVNHRFITSFFDITERKRAEERLRKQATLLDSATDAIHVRAMDHTVTYWNDGATRLYALPAAEAVGRKVNELGLVEREEFAAAHATLLARGDWSGEVNEVGRDGRKRVVFCRWTLLRDGRGEPNEVLAIHADITERKQLEARYLQAQRMQGIGLLAGGIAHDLNNILTPIMMSAGLLRQAVRDESNLQMVDAIQASAQRAADIIRQLLTFARGRPDVRAVVPIRQLLEEMEKLIREAFPRNIRSAITVPERLWPVVGDGTQIHQALMNLCVNARDAMPGGGNLWIEASNVTLDATAAALMPDAKPGPHLRISVRDSGVGISPAELEHIFDPFFTTKEMGKGTGLGLPTVLGIMRGHGGSVQVESRVGHGTLVELYLPASLEAEPDEKPAAKPELRQGRGELILVVDDEPSVRSAIKCTLETHGYRMLAAADGAEALALYSRQQPEIRAVLTDMMMPGMDGQTLIRELRKRNGKLPILGMTGLLARADVQGSEEPVAVPLVTKPFEVEKLLMALHETLESRIPTTG